MTVEFAIILVFLYFGYLLFLLVTNKPSPNPQPSKHAEPDFSALLNHDRIAWHEERIRDLMRELKSPSGYWTYANVPAQLQSEMERLLEQDNHNKIALTLQQHLPRIRRACSTKMALLRIADSSAKAETASTVITKQKYAKEAIQIIEAALHEGIADGEALRAKLPELRRYIAQVEIDGFTGKAKRFLFKGNKKKALEHYQDALYSALHDDIDDAQQAATIDSIKATILEIEAELAASRVKNKAS